MAFSINVRIFSPEQVSHRPAFSLLFKFGSTTFFNLSRSSDMRFLEFPTYGSKSDHERVRSYIPRDDPGDEGNPIFAGVEFCCNCRILRWLGLRRPPEEVPAFRYQESAGMPVSSTCELCQAICASFLSANRIKKITLSLGRLADAIAVNKPWPDRERPCDLLFIDIEDKTGCTVTQGTAFSLTLSAQTERVTVRQIEPKSVDYTEVRLWIDHCDSTHGLSCHTATKLDVPGFKVIDCFNRKVVPLPDLQTQYVALSYVWGNPKRKVDSSERFPQTIEDSIAVTSRLGYRYLWVDRYVSNMIDIVCTTLRGWADRNSVLTKGTKTISTYRSP
ncbi:hypothetical protein IG631_16890 [Alternaria alternata]|nr:hypothetical protein IG631_16890 [Alternaria alternata]